MVKREHNKRVSEFWVDTDRQQRTQHHYHRPEKSGSEGGDSVVVFSVFLSVSILVLTLSYHVFLTTIAFRNTYPNQPYTSHALHALSWLKWALQFCSRNSLYD